MKHTRVLVSVALSLLCCLIHGKTFTRSQLTHELIRHNFPRRFLSNWVCLAEQVSDRNTAAFTEKSPRRKYYGIFQIGSKWCREGRKGGRCDVTCESLLNDNIKDDSACAQKVFRSEGFKYWNRWEARCKGKSLPDIEKCPDLAVPSLPSRASPPRSRRWSEFKRILTLIRNDV